MMMNRKWTKWMNWMRRISAVTIRTTRRCDIPEGRPSVPLCIPQSRGQSFHD